MMRGRFIAGALVAGLSIVAVTAFGQGRRTARSSHGGITAGVACSACHTPEGWALARGSAGGGFDHGRTGFPLTGQHRSAACTQCHRPGRRIARACTTCHEDAHNHRLGDRCDRCHQASGWDRVSALEAHRGTRLPLTGMHALADCSECHRSRGERAYSRVPADCYACHAGRYRGAGVHPIHDGSGGAAPFPRDCGRCHGTLAWEPATVDVSALPGRAPLIQASQHDLHFRISSGPHRVAACTDCHVSQRAPRAVRCAGCHTRRRMLRVHANRSLPRSASACLTCHVGGRR